MTSKCTFSKDEKVWNAEMKCYVCPGKLKHLRNSTITTPLYRVSNDHDDFARDYNDFLFSSPDPVETYKNHIKQLEKNTAEHNNYVIHELECIVGELTYKYPHNVVDDEVHFNDKSELDKFNEDLIACTEKFNSKTCELDGDITLLSKLHVAVRFSKIRASAKKLRKWYKFINNIFDSINKETDSRAKIKKVIESIKLVKDYGEPYKNKEKEAEKQRLRELERQKCEQLYGFSIQDYKEEEFDSIRHRLGLETAPTYIPNTDEKKKHIRHLKNIRRVLKCGKKQEKLYQYAYNYVANRVGNCAFSIEPEELSYEVLKKIFLPGKMVSIKNFSKYVTITAPVELPQLEVTMKSLDEMVYLEFDKKISKIHDEEIHRFVFADDFNIQEGIKALDIINFLILLTKNLRTKQSGKIVWLASLKVDASIITKKLDEKDLKQSTENILRKVNKKIQAETSKVDDCDGDLSKLADSRDAIQNIRHSVDENHPMYKKVLELITEQINKITDLIKKYERERFVEETRQKINSERYALLGRLENVQDLSVIKKELQPFRTGLKNIVRHTPELANELKTDIDDLKKIISACKQHCHAVISLHKIVEAGNITYSADIFNECVVLSGIIIEILGMKPLSRTDVLLKDIHLYQQMITLWDRT